MGVWITQNCLEISDKSSDNSVMKQIGYQEINEEFIDIIVNHSNIKVIQISKELPYEAYMKINSILEKRNNLIFRIYGLYGISHFDISFLKHMSYLYHLRIDCDLTNRPNAINFNIIKELNVTSLFLDVFDLHDYSFIKELSNDIEHITINADTMGKAIKFDCKWLLQYEKLHTLWLGKKAKKNLECLSELSSLTSLSLRGIKLSSFEFLKQLKLETFELLWNSNRDLLELKELKTLKQIGLWRINKLESIDFISELVNLEIMKLKDLKHLKQLPDLRKLTHLKTMVLDNVSIDIEELSVQMQQKVEKYWK